MSEIEEKKKKRFQFLHRLYELTGGDELKCFDISTIGKELGFDSNLTRNIVQYLKGEGLIKVIGDQGLIGISHPGTIEVEKALSSPDTPTSYFPPVNIISIGQMISSQIQQASSEATTKVISSPTETPPPMTSHIERKKHGMEKQGKNIFIGHGRSPVWRELKDFLQVRLNLEWDEFDRESVPGFGTLDRLKTMLDNACFAFIIMTAEDEHPDQTKHARENVIHELGLFQGRLGFEKAIVLREETCAEFSNIRGLQQIPFPPGQIMAKSEEIRRVLEREGILPSGASKRMQAPPSTVVPGLTLDTRMTGGLIQRIDFDYFPGELPTEKDWQLVQGSLPRFTLADYYGGKAIKIQEVPSSQKYALDHDVSPDTRERGRTIEFVAEYKPGRVVYARIDAQSKDRSTSPDSWIQIKIGRREPKKHDKLENEWIIWTMPTELKGNWQLFQINLITEFERTFGTEGKSFEGLTGFRLRGNLELAYIAVFE